MKYLLDTHALLWLATNSPNLSPSALAIISDPSNAGYFSMMSLPWHHKDPFDRILVATALEEGMVLLSTDDLLRQYGVPVQW